MDPPPSLTCGIRFCLKTEQYRKKDRNIDRTDRYRQIYKYANILIDKETDW